MEVKGTHPGVRLTGCKSQLCDHARAGYFPSRAAVLICKMKHIVCTIALQDYCEDKRSPTLASRPRCDTAAAGIVVFIFCMYDLLLSLLDIRDKEMVVELIELFEQTTLRFTPPYLVFPFSEMTSKLVTSHPL